MEARRVDMCIEGSDRMTAVGLLTAKVSFSSALLCSPIRLSKSLIPRSVKLCIGSGTLSTLSEKTSGWSNALGRDRSQPRAGRLKYTKIWSLRSLLNFWAVGILKGRRLCLHSRSVEIAGIDMKWQWGVCCIFRQVWCCDLTGERGMLLLFLLLLLSSL